MRRIREGWRLGEDHSLSDGDKGCEVLRSPDLARRMILDSLSVDSCMAERRQISQPETCEETEADLERTSDYVSGVRAPGCPGNSQHCDVHREKMI